MASVPPSAELEWQELHMHDNEVPQLIAANVVCLSLACIAVILRFLARRVAKINYQADDWLILAGLVGSTSSSPLLSTLFHVTSLSLHSIF